jgi:hypothetical protein
LRPQRRTDEEVTSARCALQSLRFRCSPAATRTRPGVLSRIWPLVQSSASAALPPSWVRRARCAVGRNSLGCAGFSRRSPLLTVRQAVEPSLRVPPSTRVLPSEIQPVGRSPPTPLLGFASLQHMQGSKVHLPRALPARYVPPAGFGYPLGGLRPSSPGRLCFAPAALLGFTLRSLLLPQGNHARFRTDGPTYRFARRYPRRPKAKGRPNGPRFLGFDPCGNPWRPASV